LPAIKTDPWKLLDGGLVDNFGLAGISIGMLAAQRPYEPMTERQAAHVRRMMFVVVDAGRGLSGNWANRLDGPTGVELVSAAADTAIDASVRSSFTAFSGLINEWTARVRHWRCSLSEADRARLALEDYSPGNAQRSAPARVNPNLCDFSKR
jgi:NTE family protein